jgi:predicted nucleic acid-binding protein
MISFDTGPLIWGVQGAAQGGQHAMIARTKSYLKFLQKDERKILIAAPVLAEFVRGIADEKQRDEVVNFLMARFVIGNLDAKAAVLAAKLEQAIATKQVRKPGESRQEVRVDAQIVAISISNKAERIVTHDPHFKALANGEIEVSEVPLIQETGELFDNTPVKDPKPSR